MTLQVSGAISNFMTILAPYDNYDRPKLYDWLLILPHEVKYIWRASWNWSKILYLLTRYIPFATIALALRSELLLTGSLNYPPTHPSRMKLTSHACLYLTLHSSVRICSHHPRIIQSTFTNFPLSFRPVCLEPHSRFVQEDASCHCL